MKKQILIIALLLYILEVKCSAGPLPKLVVKTHIFKDGVAIRWTPADLKLWQNWSVEGYRLERYAIAKNGVPVDKAEGLLLGGKNIKPLNDLQWQEYANSVPEANLVWTCLKKDTVNNVNSKEALLNAIEEDNQCYIFSMLAMQSKFELAVASGIGFIDNTTDSHSIYLYKLYPVNSSDRDTQFFVVDMQEPTMLPVVDSFNAEIVDNRILLAWDAQKYSDVYFGFRIEKSLDAGRSYTPVNTIPIVPTLSDAETFRKMEIFSDTISCYHQPIYYRISGLNYFGQYGQSSFPDSVVVFPETLDFPKFIEVRNTAVAFSTIYWQFDELNESLIKGFKILVSDSSEGTFEDLDSILIAATSRNVELHVEKPAFYIRVAAISLNGIYRTSFPVMVQQVDSFPPAPPRVLSLSVDTAGIATLNWQANKENDFMAYLVFKGNDRYQEFSSITQRYHMDTFIMDTLNNEMIRDSIFYKLIAVDTRYNESVYSEILAAYIPNTIPPAPPVLYDVQRVEQSVVVKWYPSNSDDVVFYHLHKLNMGTGIREIIKIDKSLLSYRDTQIISGESYRYSISAFDHSGLESKSANPIEVHIPIQKLMPPVRLLSFFNDTARNFVAIFWTYPYEMDVSHYRILQIDENGASRTLGTAKFGETFFNYYYLKPYTMKNYYIVAYFKDGRRSKI